MNQKIDNEVTAEAAEQSNDVRAIRSNSEPATYWWIAINKSSCTASSFPLPSTVKVLPTPESLVGFNTRSEQLSAQRTLLKAPMVQVRAFVAELANKEKRGEVIITKFKNAQNPSDQTLWCCEPKLNRPT